MADLLTLENAINLVMLCFLQAVLGFDNLLYISIESQRGPVAQQKSVRTWGILVAVALRVVLLFVMIQLIASLSAPFYIFDWPVVFIFGGVFIMYTAVKEIGHMLSMDALDHDVDGKSSKSALHVIILIVVMNLIFSFDSVLSALAITDVFPVLATAIILSGLAMLLLADGVTRFLEKNRMYEVLGLFILLIVGVVLLGEAGPAAGHAMENDALNIRVFDTEIIPMSKSTFYFSVIVLFAVEILQSGYSRKLNAERKALQKHS
uniref:TerC family protein n=1 Tax=Yoonia sp. TaxID=2212373 RepID=UPI0040479F66